MAHLLGVASLVMGEAGHVLFPVTEDMVIAALLHDAVEDHGGPSATRRCPLQLRRQRRPHGRGALRYVGRGPEQKEPWEQRKQDYLDAPSRSNRRTSN